MRLDVVFIAATLLSSSLLAAGQMSEGGPGQRGPRAFGFRSGKVVTGLPYSAEVNSSSVRVLPDGNRIQRTMSGKVARDSEGRTYSTETMTGLFGQSGSKTITFISDPVAGYSYTLNAEKKTAVRRPIRGPEGRRADGMNRVRPEAARPGSDTADLGTQVVNGLNAEGKKYTHTVPAGAMGNEQPIVSTSETWFSPELQIVVSAKRSDPRDGTSMYTLNNIQKVEPAATLFQIPADYTVKDAASFEHGEFGGRR